MLFAAIRDAIEATSLREVARQLKMAPTGVSKVLAGTTPLPHTMRKLEAWWLRRALAEPSLASPDLVKKAALRLLTRSLPPWVQDEVATELAAMLDGVKSAPEDPA